MTTEKLKTPASATSEKVDHAFDQLRSQLSEVAAMNLDDFIAMLGIDKAQAVACIERSRGLSWGQISTKTGISRSSLQKKCRKCTPIAYR